MAAVAFRSVTFAFGGGLPVFSHVSFRLSPGVHGVVGENGAGKTTLLRLAAGDLSPDSGSVSVEPRGAICALCPQTACILGDEVRHFALATSSEAVILRDLLALDPASLERWETLSFGERRRWQIGALLVRDPDVLLADEPTNHLDTDARDRIIAAFKRFRGTALVVSHDRAFLDAVTGSTLRLHNGSAERVPLPYSMALAEQEREEQARLAEREARKAEVGAAARRLAEARDRRARADGMRSSKRRMKDKNDNDARGALAKGKVARAEGRMGRLVAARRTDLERARAEIPAFEGGRPLGRSIFFEYELSPRPRVMELSEDAIFAGEKRILSDVRVSVARQARIHIAGKNGAGKTTLVRALIEKATLPPDRMFYLPQEIDQEEASSLLAGVRELDPAGRGRALSLLAALGTDPARVLGSSDLSPGEAKKLALALAIGRRAWVLVLDEPTNHLDLPSIERVEAALSLYPGALVMVSHDDRFSEKLAEERWSIRKGRLHVESIGPSVR